MYIVWICLLGSLLVMLHSIQFTYVHESPSVGLRKIMSTSVKWGLWEDTALLLHGLNNLMV